MPALRPFSQSHSLAPRQQDVLAPIKKDLGNRAIARALAIDLRNGESHGACLLIKTGSRNRTQLAIWALTTGVGHPPSGPAEAIHP